MASYVVLTPPDSPYPDDETVLIRDGFSWLALLIPLLWLLWYRLWFPAALLLLLSVAIAMLAGQFPGYSMALTAATALVSAFVAMEGNGWRIAKKERQGWAFRSVVDADNRATAEEIWFDAIEQRTVNAAPAAPPEPRPRNIHPAHAGSGPALGLIDYGDRG